MNANTFTNKQESYSKRIGAYRSAYFICKEWLLANARIQGQRRILSIGIQKKSTKSTSRNLVCSKWNNWERIAFRPYLSDKKLRESITFTKSNTATKYNREQQKYPGIQREENSLSKGTSIRQKIWWTTILFNLSGRKNKTAAQKMGTRPSFGWGLDVKLNLV